jgi:hypothetical protein
MISFYGPYSYIRIVDSLSRPSSFLSWPFIGELICFWVDHLHFVANTRRRASFSSVASFHTGASIQRASRLKNGFSIIEYGREYPRNDVNSFFAAADPTTGNSLSQMYSIISKPTNLSDARQHDSAKAAIGLISLVFDSSPERPGHDHMYQVNA